MDLDQSLIEVFTKTLHQHARLILSKIRTRNIADLEENRKETLASRRGRTQQTTADARKQVNYWKRVKTLLNLYNISLSSKHKKHYVDQKQGV
jgi:hypothetical protein